MTVLSVDPILPFTAYDRCRKGHEELFKVELTLGVVALVAAAFSLLLCFGIMRELVLIRSHLVAFRRMLTNPPVPDYVGEHSGLDESLVAVGQSLDSSMPQALLFVSASCPSCEELLNELAALPTLTHVATQLAIIVMLQQGEEVPEHLYRFEQVGARIVKDEEGRLGRRARVVGTPTCVIVSGRTAIDFSAGVSADWIQERLMIVEMGVATQPGATG